MSITRRVLDHCKRVSRQVGAKTKVGPNRYWVRGYISNIVDVGSAGEPEILEVIRRVLNRPGAFIDVGVNLGQTLGKVLQVDPCRQYVGFEPQIGACHLINEFISDNALANAIVLPLALDSRPGIKALFSRGSGDSMASFEQSSRHDRRTWIIARRGDDVLEELSVSRCAVIKVDVEGAELEVMEGLVRTIQTQRCPVIFEVLPNFVGPNRIALESEVAKRRTIQARKLWMFWGKLGYRVMQIDEKGSEHPIDGFNLDDPQSFRGSNYLAVSVE